jgi:hypothetical protein
VDSLLKIGDTAENTGNTKVTLKILAALKRIENEAKDPKTVTAASHAAETLRRQ